MLHSSELWKCLWGRLLAYHALDHGKLFWSLTAVEKYSHTCYYLDPLHLVWLYSAQHPLATGTFVVNLLSECSSATLCCFGRFVMLVVCQSVVWNILRQRDIVLACWDLLLLCLADF